MKTRSLVAIPLLGLLYLLLFVLPPVALTIAISAASALCAYELSRAFVKRRWLNVLTAAVAAGVVWIYFPTAEWLLHQYIIWSFMPLILVVCTALVCLFLYAKRTVPVIGLGKEIAFSLFPALLLPALLRTMKTSIFWEPLFSRALIIMPWRTLLMPFLVAIGTDTCAYLVGRAVGKHKMAPVISPNKTWEGAVGGLLGGVLFLTAYALIPVDGKSLTSLLGLPWVLSCGLLGSLAGQAGDLCFSALKRRAGIKDFGNLLPGHGGLLDRLDSLLFVIPTVAFWGTIWTQWAL